jgi:hypothetical protein
MNKQLIFSTIAAACLFASCNDNDFGETGYTNPAFEAATVASTVVMGDSIAVSATVTDPGTNLKTLTAEVYAGDVLLTSKSFFIGNKQAEVDSKVKVPLGKAIDEGAQLTVKLVAANMMNRTAERSFTVTASRPNITKLYLVPENGEPVELLPQAGNSNKFEAKALMLSPAFNYYIAQSVSGNAVDFSKMVWGSVNGHTALVEEGADRLFAYAPESNLINEVVFDVYNFQASFNGVFFEGLFWSEATFSTATSAGGETLGMTHVELEKDTEISLSGDLATLDVVFNMDFFERIDAKNVKFIAPTGEYDIYYNAVRKNVIVGVAAPAYPDYLLANGWGLGYPTKVSTEAIQAVYPGRNLTTTDWNFNDVLSFILFRAVTPNVFQATVFLPGAHDNYASFKPFENSGWANEKKATDFTFTGENIIVPGASDGNWNIPNDQGTIVETKVRRITINLNTMNCNIESVDMP